MVLAPESRTESFVSKVPICAYSGSTRKRTDDMAVAEIQQCHRGAAQEEQQAALAAWLAERDQAEYGPPISSRCWRKARAIFFMGSNGNAWFDGTTRRGTSRPRTASCNPRVAGMLP
jgi:hypothetical protein